MQADERSAETEATRRSRFRLRSDRNRWCPRCDEVALVFDVEAGRARCRSCGTLD